jgi:hypothetical protein
MSAALRSNPRSPFVDAGHAKQNLILYAMHTSALYDARVRLDKLIKRQIETGHYSIEGGQKLWRGWFDHAAALYQKEFGGDSSIRFPDAVRNAATKEWEETEREYIAEGSTPAGKPFEGEKPNPLARQGYRRRAALNKDLERYYSGCMTGHSAKRFKSKARRESYCSAVSWKVARQAGRYPDYFKGVRSNPVYGAYALVIAAIPSGKATHVEAEVVDVTATREAAMRELAIQQRRTVGMDSAGMAWAVVRLPHTDVPRGTVVRVPVKGLKFSFDDAGSMSIKRNPIDRQLTKLEAGELRKVANNEGMLDSDQLMIRRRLADMGYLDKDLRLTAKGRAYFVVIKETPMPMMTMIKNPLPCPCEKNPILTWTTNQYGRFPYTAAVTPSGTYVINKAFMQMAENAYTLQLMRGGRSLSLGDYRSIAEAKAVAQHDIDSGKIHNFGMARENPLKNPLSTPVKTGIIVAGVVFVAGLIYAMTTKTASAAPASSSPSTPLQPPIQPPPVQPPVVVTPSAVKPVTLEPVNFQIVYLLGATTVLVSLPAGGVWASAVGSNAAGPAGTSTPVSLPVGIFDFFWTDSSGNPQHTTMSISA